MMMQPQEQLALLLKSQGSLSKLDGVTRHRLSKLTQRSERSERRHSKSTPGLLTSVGSSSSVIGEPNQMRYALRRSTSTSVPAESKRDPPKHRRSRSLIGKPKPKTLPPLEDSRGRRASVKIRRDKIMVDEELEVLESIEDRARRHEKWALQKVTMLALAVGSRASVLSQCMVLRRRKKERRAAALTIGSLLRPIWHRYIVCEKMKLVTRLAMLMRGRLALVIHLRIFRRRRARKILRYSLENVLRPYRKFIIAATRIRILGTRIQRVWRAFSAATKARIAVLNSLFELSMHNHAAREEASLEKAWRYAEGKDFGPLNKADFEHFDTKRDGIRERRWREIQAGVHHIETRLRRAESIVELSHYSDYVYGLGRRTSLINLHSKQVSISRRSGVLLEVLRTLRRASVVQRANRAALSAPRYSIQHAKDFLVDVRVWERQRDTKIRDSQVLTFFSMRHPATLKRHVDAIYQEERQRAKSIHNAKRDARLRMAGAISYSGTITNPALLIMDPASDDDDDSCSEKSSVVTQL